MFDKIAEYCKNEPFHTVTLVVLIVLAVAIAIAIVLVTAKAERSTTKQPYAEEAEAEISPLEEVQPIPAPIVEENNTDKA